MSLGRGLKSLIPDREFINSDGESRQFSSVEVEKIIANPEQPRMKFDEELLKELAESIREHGVIEPLVVRKSDDHYVLIAGERRLRAAKIANLREVPVIIENLDDEELLKVALIENIQREDLNIVELANGYQRLIEKYNYSQEDLSKIVGKKRSSITNILRILKLPEEIQELLLLNSISFGAARALLTLKDKDEQLKIAEMIKDKGMSVREVERLIKKLSKPKNLKEDKDPFITDLEERLSEKVDASIKIKNRNNKGKIEIHYSSLDHLNSILERIGLQEKHEVI